MKLYNNKYYIIYGEIDLLKENMDGTEEDKRVDFCRIPKYYKGVRVKLGKFKNEG